MRSGAFAWLANGKLSIGLDEPREGARGFYDLIVPAALGPHARGGLVSGRAAALGRAGGWGFPMAARSAPPWPNRCGGSGRSDRRGGLSFSLARAGRTNAGPPNLTPSWSGCLAATNPGFHFAILGGEEDRALGEVIARADGSRCLDLTGRLSLPEMVEWIRLSELMVTNDTGPMHVAAALGKPVVALFGPTEPRRTGPYRQLDHVLQLDLPCVPCLKPRCAYAKPLECLRAIPPAAVLTLSSGAWRPSKGKVRSGRTARPGVPDFYGLPPRRRRLE